MKNLLLLLGVILLIILPLRFATPAEEGAEIFTGAAAGGEAVPAAPGMALFAGADGEAEAEIGRLRPDYEPWFSPFWEPPSSEIETLLFGLQAAIGAGLVAYCLGFYRGRRSAAASRAA